MGEATLEVVKGVMPLREVLLTVLSPPYRLVAEKVREPSGLPFSLVVEGVAREVLLALRDVDQQKLEEGRGGMG